MSPLERFPNLYRNTMAGAAVLAGSLGIASCACEPDQVTLETPGTTALEMTSGDVGTTIASDELAITTELQKTTTTEAPTTTSTIPAPAETTAPSVETHTRESNAIDMYGFGGISMGMSRQDILSQGYDITQSCGEAQSVRTDQPGGLEVKFNESEQVDEISTWDWQEDSGYEVTLPDEQPGGVHAHVGSYGDELTHGYYKKYYDNGQLEYRSMPNNGQAYVLTAFPETGNNLWFVLYNGQVKAIVLAPIGEVPQGC